MEQGFLDILRWVPSLMGFGLVALVTRAISKGKNYIAATNFNWSNYVISNAFAGDRFALWMFKATPIAIMVASGWAGYAIMYDLLFPLGNAGFFDQEDGEWQSYRSVLSGMIGATLGVCFSLWLVQLCEESLSADLLNEELSPLEQLKTILGK